MPSGTGLACREEFIEPVRVVVRGAPVNYRTHDELDLFCTSQVAEVQRDSVPVYFVPSRT